MIAAGHDPYALTLHQLLTFNESVRERRQEDRAIAAIDARFATKADGDGFEEHIRELLDLSDPDTFDFDDLEEE
ncbi:hypothetical protein [Sulfitobacter dubius]|uniref:hypothetical protein n=1 Tax=Sulfitobacter dubius TaxID=218673 RepID=UPI0022AEB88B|nr:hypothetical protein [Sulfitobacter dubius]MCZ4366618.1 hypothetical protein [Sulfitobacter dubius]